VAFFDTLRAVTHAVEVNAPHGPASAERLLTVVSELAQACGLEAEEVEVLRTAALVRDVGMSGVGTCAPQWERPLSTVEWGLVKVHPVIAAHALAQIPETRDAVPIVLHHHEHFDGNGYVDGLAGECIPLASRILTVADAFVAMTSARPYRQALSVEDALAELRAKSGTQFDPSVVDAIARLVGERDGWTSVWG
jgi:HD-GYP domain-containing protein (c-di-GMP phosphodiesterase class II)